MIEGVLGYFATSGATVAVGVFSVAVLCYSGSHRDLSGTIVASKIAGAFGIAMATYTFLVAAGIHLLFKTATLTQVISNGFGEERFAYLLAGVSLDGLLRLWKSIDEKP